MNENKLRQIAQGLLIDVGGYSNEESIAAIIEIFQLIINDCDRHWEKCLYAETDEILAHDNIHCECGNLIQIKRKGKNIHVEVI